MTTIIIYLNYNYNSYNIVKEKENNKKESKKESKTKIKTDSKVLKSLLDSLEKRDFDSFDKVYDAKVIDLRKKGDHSEFYNSFKNLFLDNDLDKGQKDALLGLLSDTNTKDSLNLLFEIYDEGIITDHDVQFDQAKYMLDSVNSMVYEPSIDFNEVIDTLKREYKKTKIKPLKEALGMMIARYDNNSKKNMSFLFSSYLNAKDDDIKKAAYEALMDMRGDDLLPTLGDYLGSDYKKVHKMAGEMLVNIGTSNAVEQLNDWVIEKATIDNADELKEWYKQIMQKDGKEIVIKTWDDRVDKIKDEQLKEEIRSFLDEQREE